MQTAAAAFANPLPSALDETHPALQTSADRVAPPTAQSPLQFQPAPDNVRSHDLQSPAAPSPKLEDKAAATPSKGAPYIAVLANHRCQETVPQAIHPLPGVIYFRPPGASQAATRSTPADLQWFHNPPETASAFRHVVAYRPSANRRRLARPTT